jgi:methionyl aminopeptidase
MLKNNKIIIKNQEQVEGIRQAAKLVAEFLDVVLPTFVKSGIKTIQIDEIAEQFCLQNKVKASFRDVEGYHNSTCTAINNQVVHAIPGEREVKDGDILKVDFGITKNGFIGDATRTYLIGEVNPKVKKLVEVTRQALELACEATKPGNRIGDIGYVIQKHVERNGFSVVREYVGHGVGINLHEPPSVPHYGRKGTGIELKPGMVIAIEPMINMGTWRTKVLEDGWTVVTMDGKWSCQFEHTVLVTEKGSEILTQIKE